MQRRLVVMRHAKSSWNSDAPTDHARPLNSRGRGDAPRVAARLAELGWTPQCVLSSDSERTRQTYQLMREHLAGDPQVSFLQSFYHAGIDELRYELSAVADDISAVLTLGHNPGWEDVVYRLTGQEVSLTTANAALLLGEGPSWQQAVLASGTWELHEVIRPKEL